MAISLMVVFFWGSLPFLLESEPSFAVETLGDFVLPSQISQRIRATGGSEVILLNEVILLYIKAKHLADIIEFQKICQVCGPGDPGNLTEDLFFPPHVKLFKFSSQKEIFCKYSAIFFGSGSQLAKILQPRRKRSGTDRLRNHLDR
jgi:hypothetical protein